MYFGGEEPDARLPHRADTTRRRRPGPTCSTKGRWPTRPDRCTAGSYGWRRARGEPTPCRPTATWFCTKGLTPIRCRTWRSRTTTCAAATRPRWGPIAEDQRFYLESRGVPPAVADRLIALGFLDGGSGAASARRFGRTASDRAGGQAGGGRSSRGRTQRETTQRPGSFEAPETPELPESPESSEFSGGTRDGRAGANRPPTRSSRAPRSGWRAAPTVSAWSASGRSSSPSPTDAATPTSACPKAMSTSTTARWSAGSTAAPSRWSTGSRSRCRPPSRSRCTRSAATVPTWW